MATLQATPTETALPLVLTIDQEGVGGVTGQAPVVAIRDGATANMWLDFFDMTFKLAAWVQRQAPLAEISAALAPGTYQYTLDVSAIVGIAVGMQLVAEYDVNLAPIIGVDHDSIEIVSSTVSADPRISFSATATGVAPAQVVAVLASLVRNGVQVTVGLVGATCTMRDPTGVVIFGPLPLIAQPNGYFSLSVAALSLINATNYNFEVTITDAIGPVTEFVITPTVGP